MIRNVLFDLDDTLFDFHKAEKIALTKTLVHFGIDPTEETLALCRDENGEPTAIPYDSAGYMDIAPGDKGENVRREICLTLEQMGIRPECSHHEQGPGQNEIDFRYAEPVKAFDAYEQNLIRDVIAARIPAKLDRSRLFTD